MSLTTKSSTENKIRFAIKTEINNNLPDSIGVLDSLDNSNSINGIDSCITSEEQLRYWHEKILNYSHLVERWTKYFWGINKAFLYSYEDLEQTIWYILIVGLKEFDGRGSEENFLNWYVRQKVLSVIMYGRKPPKTTDAPFTPLKFDYVSPDDSAVVNELFYSEFDVE